ncbi:MAG: hypothetical protein ACJ74D_11835 [Gaiellaceae bacterium]
MSKSSVSLWVRDIELTPAQQQALLERNPAYNRQHSGWAKVAQRRREERIAFQEDGRRRARLRDPGFVAGCMLYWAEGSKDRNQLQFSNSDLAMARFFVDFLKKYFGLQPSEIRITCHLYADHLAHQRQIEQRWLDALGLGKESLRKSVVNVYSKYIQELGGFTRDAWLE